MVCKSKRVSALLVTSLLLGACASKPRVIVDTKGHDPQQYQTDLADCTAYGEQVDSGNEAAKGAVAGAVIGGLLGAALGNSDTAGTFAGAGAVAGGAGNASDAELTKDKVVKNCMRGRGYRVLN